MKQFENKVLHIKDEAMLSMCMELLDQKNVIIDFSNFNVSAHLNQNYLKYCKYEQDFSVGLKNDIDIEITLEEFKQLLNQ